MKTQILEKNWIFFDRSIVLKEQHDYDRKNHSAIHPISSE
jgi:hypothetical protein